MDNIVRELLAAPNPLENTQTQPHESPISLRVLTLFGVLGAACALVPSLAMWNFTVDDALIPIRYAHHLATGVGYRFNADGPSTDGVTPLPWAFLLAPFAKGDALTTLACAKVLGVVAWTGAGAALGVAAARLAGPARLRLVLAALGLAVVALAFPIGAWAASGLETGVATALATVASVAAVRSGPARPRRPLWTALIAGLAATLRPELVVWAVALAMTTSASTMRASGASLDARTRGVRVAVALGVAAAVASLPFASIAVTRLAIFGRPAPLALLAKPSDPSHGLVYAAAAVIVLLTPLLAFAPLAVARASGPVRAVAIAFVAHIVVVIMVGGDWMPYARLTVPVAPSLALVFAGSTARGKSLWPCLRLALAAMLGVVLAVRAAPAGRHVGVDREALIVRARPVLANARVVAALDVGWVSASTNARVVDLAGLTDPVIASLGGGHTSKRASTAMLLDRDVDTVVVYSDLRVVEHRIVDSDLFAERFTRDVTLPLGEHGAFYTVYRRSAR